MADEQTAQNLILVTDDSASSAPARPTDVQLGQMLPTSVPKVQRNFVYHNGMAWIPIFCANCGKDGGFIPEETKDFAFYLCEPCGDKWEPLAGTMLVPDEVFWERVKQTQLEKWGRLLSDAEMIEALKDENNPMAKLAKDRHLFYKE